LKVKALYLGCGIASAKLFLNFFTNTTMWLLLLAIVGATVIMALETARRVRNLVTPAPVSVSSR
jgi:uncharacterized protein (DUF983 family)